MHNPLFYDDSILNFNDLIQSFLVTTNQFQPGILKTLDQRVIAFHLSIL